MNYQKYISSHRWRTNAARLSELEAAGFCCRICNEGGAGVVIEVHHRTYANLGNEQPGDLTTLCRTCHRMATDHLRRTRYAKRTPVHADIRPVSEAPFQLFDPTVTEALQ